MIKEVLDVWPICQSWNDHDCCFSWDGFAKEVADRVIFMDEGSIVEEKPTAEFFAHPENERTKLFLSQILG